MAEQRYEAVLAVIGDGRTVTEVAASWEVSRQTLHTWLATAASARVSRSDPSGTAAQRARQLTPGLPLEGTLSPSSLLFEG